MLRTLNRMYWNCESKKAKNCKGRLLSNVRGEKFYFVSEVEHNHEPNPLRIHEANVNAEAKSLALRSKDKPIAIRRAALSIVPPDVSLPMSRGSLTQKIKYLRNKERPDEPTDLDFIIPVEYNVTLNNVDFLRDINVNGIRINLFITDNGIRLLSRSNVWLMDGTFKTFPNLFLQLYTIHCSV